MLPVSIATQKSTWEMRQEVLKIVHEKRAKEAKQETIPLVTEPAKDDDETKTLILTDADIDANDLEAVNAYLNAQQTEFSVEK